MPTAEAADVPDESVFVEQAATMRDREIEPPEADEAIEGSLMEAPEPVEATSVAPLHEDAVDGLVAPVLVEFDNGVRVSLNVTPIAEGEIAFEARSPGGSTVLADADVPAADAAPAVIADSGVATYDAVSLDAFLSDKSVEFDLSIDPFTEGLTGYTSTDDIETLFQLIHLTMTAPRVDPLAVDRYLDDQLPFATDPSIDPGYAGVRRTPRRPLRRSALPAADRRLALDGRGGRHRAGRARSVRRCVRLELRVQRRPRRRRHGRPGRAVSRHAAVERAGRAGRRTSSRPRRPGIVDEDTTGGSGSQANVSFLFTAPATIDRRDDVAAMIVQEILTARLTDVIREQLGESYSPFAVVEVAAGPTPNVEIVPVHEHVGRAGRRRSSRGSSGSWATYARTVRPRRSSTAPTETVRQQLDLVYNEQVNDEVLDVLVDPAGNPDFGDYLGQSALVDDLDRAAITTYLVDLDPPRPATSPSPSRPVVSRGQAPTFSACWRRRRCVG